MTHVGPPWKLRMKLAEPQYPSYPLTGSACDYQCLMNHEEDPDRDKPFLLSRPFQLCLVAH